ncbi:LamG domain-containing protein [Flavobacterium sp. 245]|uniref:LamG domain-containing protein n=1 Tax=Flavobacterium sp. 245 TaxID=2512115 RepID=UPI001060AF18|nr:LamG domain-containing protein [Flavobacterium sp. 245]TDP01296.1 concanavalin A-like lectin/glucanase superfamily protein [Flavobacterium sp. 245]
MKKLLLSLMFVSYLNANAQNPIQEFNFNGTLNNTQNTISFMGTDNFVSDRMGNPSGAQRLNNKALEAVIDDLPQNNSARSISIWVKLNDISKANYILGYGTAFNAQYYGLLQQATASSNSDLSQAGWGASNDVIVSVPLAKGKWYNYTITYDGAVSKIYRDGVLVKALDGITRATKGNIFRLGEINTTVGINADIDDLKIFNVALTDEQVAAFYEESKPVIAIVADAAPAVKTPAVKTATGKGKVAVKAAPSTAIISNRDINAADKNVEVYSQGQKIIGDNSMSISDLPEGTYLLKITSVPAKKITSK